MDEKGSTVDPGSRVDQIKINLKSWNFFEWVFFWGIIPALLVIIYALPQTIKNDYFILDTSHIWRVQTYFLNAYTHSQVYWHLIGNVAFYFIVFLVIFALENNRRRFWVMVCCSFFLVPIVCSFLTIFFWNILGQKTTSQGFSGIGAALLAYAIFMTVIWVDQDRLETLDFPEFKAQKKILYYIVWVLLTIMAAFIVLLGIDLGQFLNAGGFTSNGIAHFGGFITSLIIVLLFDVLTEKRKNFDQIMGIAIGIGILWYVNYLVTIIRLVKTV
jgi:hypothetical protein